MEGRHSLGDANPPKETWVDHLEEQAPPLGPILSRQAFPVHLNTSISVPHRGPRPCRGAAARAFGTEGTAAPHRPPITDNAPQGEKSGG
jgi:hypothetical protein